MNHKIGIVGLGYVGFPLAVLFSRRYSVCGYDKKPQRIAELNSGKDHTNEVSAQAIKKAFAAGLTCSNHLEDLADCNIYIITVPTPIDLHRQPDLSPLKEASTLIAPLLSEGNIVIYESTVFPGVTEEVCVPILAAVSGLTFNRDFYAGYSPERINPGDKQHTVENICKITSGSTPEAAKVVDQLYRSVLTGGTHPASSIKVAEAAKVIENTQRDVNIAFMNECTKIFNAMEIDTNEVLDAASTKWNFLPFRPGLVGGHCISVDPYYLIQKAQLHGVLPRLISESRRINDSMGNYIGNQLVHIMVQRDIRIKDAKILLLGFTFKENCPDIRNTKVVDIYNTLKSYSPNVMVYDPWVEKEESKKAYGIDVMTTGLNNLYDIFDAVVYCVPHNCFNEVDIEQLVRTGGVVYDLKGRLPASTTTCRL